MSRWYAKAICTTSSAPAEVRGCRPTSSTGNTRRWMFAAAGCRSRPTWPNTAGPSTCPATALRCTGDPISWVPMRAWGPWLNEKGEQWTGVSNGKPWTGAFDVDIFIDDDNKPYLYFPGRSTDGIYVAPLDPKNPNRFAAPPRHLFGFNPAHVWERWGDKNEYTHVAWVEGPWVFKRNGIYYLEYSASGTQWLSYASGVYTSRNPLGPFTYSPRNPLLRKTTGIVTGSGHGSVVKGPDGNWWVFYTVVLANPPGGRRLGMDPVGFEADGTMFVRGPSETPQWAPGVVANPARDGDSGSIPLSVNKLRAMNQRGAFTSQRPGHEAAYALDDSNGT